MHTKDGRKKVCGGGGGPRKLPWEGAGVVQERCRGRGPGWSKNVAVGGGRGGPRTLPYVTCRLFLRTNCYPDKFLIRLRECCLTHDNRPEMRIK